ncbi:hypothetical protein CK203_052510 [Vitis vinifera]|uniref:Uncharacterized protein n=1 Tax=Vitis vinifera TaxID=29760 RepID=A0A438HCE1_VITVI|nr:hypothetical protein CK203_052510 [Vitis vinifera]
MQLVDRVPGLSSIMRATPSFLDRASIFSLYFPGKMDEYGSSDLVEGFFDGATPEDANRHELDLLVVKKMSGSIKTPIFGLSDLFGVMAIESVVEIDPLIPEVTPPFEACTMIGLAEVEMITPSLEFASKRDKANHLEALERFFERIQKFRLRLNPKKCTFGVTFGKLLGHMVTKRGIEVDPDKIRVILDMPALKIEK